MFDKCDLHEVMGLRPGELPFFKPITPAEMRIGLARAQYYNSVIRSVSIMAEREGWSGEDKYTALTFYLALQLESVTANYLRFSERVLDRPAFTSAQNPSQGGK